MKNIFGDVLKDYRLHAKLTQKALGKKMNMTQQAIAQYEKNSIAIQKDTLLKFSEILEVPYKQIILKAFIPKNFYIDLEDCELIKAIGITAIFASFVPYLQGYVYSVSNQNNSDELMNDCILFTNKYIDELKQITASLFPNSVIPYWSSKEEQKQYTEAYILTGKSMRLLNTLNDIGKREAFKRIEELTQIKKYTEPIDTQTENEKEV